MVLSSADLSDHLLTLRASLAEDGWGRPVDRPLIRLFNDLVGCAKKLCPADPIVRAIEPAPPAVRSNTLRALVDQLLLALDE